MCQELVRRAVSVSRPRDRDLDLDYSSASGLALDLDLPSERFDSIPEPGQSRPPPRIGSADAVIRKPGDYPGKEGFNQIATILTVVTFLALLSALVLLSNTMSTLIGEQTGEIASMKAIGGSRRQIARIYRRTALMLGALGAIAGVALGIVLSNVLTGYFASLF